MAPPIWTMLVGPLSWARLPEELVWNVLKYTSHPIAELIRDFIREKTQKCHCCERNIIRSKKGIHLLNGEAKFICVECHDSDVNSIITKYKTKYTAYYGWYRGNVEYFPPWDDSDSDSD